jgi:hypothetical protein
MLMTNQYITIKWIKISGRDFIQDQRKFITDAEILCEGFKNIMVHDKNCAENFINKLNLLNKKILEKYHIILTIAENISWKDEILLWMWGLLQDIRKIKYSYEDLKKKLVY